MLNQSRYNRRMHKQLAESRRIWENIAGFWDEYVGEAGNRWHNEMIAPATRTLLDAQPNEIILEVACGNGQFAREMARMGVHVTAFDFSAPFIERARQHTQQAGLDIEFHVMDATNKEQLLSLGESRFDALVANMALMDIADITPLFEAAVELLKPNGRFVFSIMHPCLNHSYVLRSTEETSYPGRGSQIQHFAKVERYLSLDGTGTKGDGIPGQPEPHLYFDRTLSGYLQAAFAAGLMLDGILEPSAATISNNNTSYWAEIPGILVCRLRKPTWESNE